LVVFGLVVVRMVATHHGSSAFDSQVAQAVGTGQRILDEIQADLTEAVKIYQGDAIGIDLIDKLDLPDDAPPIPFTRLPQLMGGGDEFHREITAGARTGNALLFAARTHTRRIHCQRRVASASDSASASASASATGEAVVERVYKLEIHRLLYYYLSACGDGPRPGSGAGLNLCRFVSEPLADVAQLEEIDHPDDLAVVLRELAVEGVTGAWRRDLVGSRDCYRLAGAALVSADRIRPDPRRSSAGMLDAALFSVATNHAPKSYGVGELGLETEVDGGFPHGFELQIVGSGSTRRMMVHLTIIASDPGSTSAPAGADLRSVIAVRDQLR
jgi:hypothetical protein